jgi:GxxExxY protein
LGFVASPSSSSLPFRISYKGHHVGLYIPDLVVFGLVVVDAKVIERISDHERGRMLNYLKITGLRVGVILNFAKPKLEWERIVSKLYLHKVGTRIDTNEHESQRSAA